MLSIVKVPNSTTQGHSLAEWEVIHLSLGLFYIFSIVLALSHWTYSSTICILGNFTIDMYNVSSILASGLLGFLLPMFLSYPNSATD